MNKKYPNWVDSKLLAAMPPKYLGVCMGHQKGSDTDWKWINQFLGIKEMTKVELLTAKINELLALLKLNPLSTTLHDINNFEYFTTMHQEDLYNMEHWKLSINWLQNMAGYILYPIVNNINLDKAIHWILIQMRDADNPFAESKGYAESRITRYDEYMEAVKGFYELREKLNVRGEWGE